ncbi:hypothetical protein O0V09_12255 [Dasania sp. GY-19]|uniref:Uncharacterized protein n=2 Tax=Dasania phycosphaerae TaxID=2950436 RepID=A0A9J6RNT5_9GAMM|nr:MULTISPECIES: hypothetical protein [Dasania]MCZ0865977.1 hypothetical protein [Dasania phycosphaerae]MCZ0869701.1 hypothetical protein [Dasania phycosphaerae]
MFAKCFTASVLVFSLMLSLNGYAKSLSAAQAELDSFKNQLIATQAELAAYNQQLQTTELALVQAANAPSPEKDIYEAAQAEVAKLSLEAAQDPSKDGELNNAQFKLTLAERKYKKSNKQLAELDDQKQNLEQKIASSTALIAKLQNNINGHSQLIAKLQQQQAANEAARIEKQRQELARLKAENERLKALQLAEQAAAAEAAALLAQQQAQQQAEAEAAALAAPAPIDRSQREPVTFLTDPTAIAAEQERLKAAASAGDGSQIGEQKTLTIRIPDQLTRSLKLHAVGGNQYQGDSKVAYGNATFSLDDYRWKAEIPKEYKYQRMEFLLDLSDAETPYMVFYVKAEQ